jgi:hypothetical protein
VLLRPPPSPAPADGPVPLAGRRAAGWSLERKLPLLIAALLAAAVGAFGAAAYREVRLAAVERAAARLAGVARQLATMAGATAAARTTALRALAASAATPS